MLMWSWISGESLATSASKTWCPSKRNWLRAASTLDCVPQDDHVNNESERPELILLSLPIALTQFAPLAVEDGATQAVPHLG